MNIDDLEDYFVPFPPKSIRFSINKLKLTKVFGVGDQNLLGATALLIHEIKLYECLFFVDFKKYYHLN